MSNVVHIDRYRAVTTISEGRVVQMLNWSPPKHGPAAGSAVHPDRATALMLAIQEVYA